MNNYHPDAINPLIDQTSPVVEFAKSMLPPELCILHRDLVRDCLAIIMQMDDEDGLSGEGLIRLQRGLIASLGGTQ